MAHPVAIDDSPYPTSRPTGVTVLAVLTAIGAVFALIGALGAMAVGGAAAAVGGGIWALFGAIFGVIMLAYAAFAAATAWGLWTRKKWAWFATVAIAAFQILMALNSLVSMEVGSALLSLAVGGIVVWYLFSPAVQAWFDTSYKVPWTYK